MLDIIFRTNRHGIFYGDHVLRDFLRCETVECSYERFVVQSVNICEENIRYAPIFSLQLVNIDCNI